MQTPNFEELTKKLIDHVKQVGSYITAEREGFDSIPVEEKGEHDLVTAVDKGAEAQLIKRLGDLIPNSGFIAEEGTSTKTGVEFNWIIDPIDGTTNFIHGLPCYSISVALEYNGRIVSGVVYELTRMECFYAWENGPAYLNGRPIRVTEASSLSQTLIATGFPYNNYDQLDNYLQLFKSLLIESRGLRRLGSAAVDLAYVACGRFDAFYENHLNAWDVAAGAFIVQQAGGRVEDFQGGDSFWKGESIVASNGALHQLIMEKIQQHY